MTLKGKPFRLMLIDNSDSSNSIQNVSYLIPIGIFLYIIFAIANQILELVLKEVGLRIDTDPYVIYWGIKIGLVLFSGSIIYIVTRRIWRRIVSGEYNCARLFVSLFIATVIALVFSYFATEWILTYVNLTAETGLNIDKIYIEYTKSLYPYLSVIEFIISVLVVTFALRSPAKNTMIE